MLVALYRGFVLVFDVPGFGYGGSSFVVIIVLRMEELYWLTD